MELFFYKIVVIEKREPLTGVYSDYRTHFTNKYGGERLTLSELQRMEPNAS